MIRKEIYNHEGEFDLCFNGINLSGALLAYFAVRSGLKVEFRLEKIMSRGFNPGIIAVYPFRTSQVVRSFFQIRFLEKLSSLFPSLLYPVKIMTVSDVIKFTAGQIHFLDRFLNREHDFISVPVNLSKYSEYKIPGEYFKRGVLVQEFRFDYEMAVFELLKICRKSGAHFSLDNPENQQIHSAKITLNCRPSNQDGMKLKIENYSLGFSNSLRIINTTGEIILREHEGDTFFHFCLQKSVSEEKFLRSAIDSLNNIGVENSERFRPELQSIYCANRTNKTYSKQEKIEISDIELNNLEKYCVRTAREISALLKKKIRVKETIGSMKRNSLDSSWFRNLLLECDEKYDLAKQTGVDYKDFSYYFFRYRNDIDELIEMAYSRMNTNRKHPEQVWLNVESERINRIEKEFFVEI